MAAASSGGAPYPLDHIALVVHRIEDVLARLGERVTEVGPIEAFPSEGTRECTIGADPRAARLLLMEPTSAEGPYARALAKRGPGLHHIALAVPDAKAFLASARGWLVHPASLLAPPTLWLARPGIGALIELCEGGTPDGAPVVAQVEVPGSGVTGAGLEAMLALRVGERPVGGLSASPDGEAWLTLGGERLSVASLTGA